jgi:hypothetical protein
MTIYVQSGFFTYKVELVSGGILSISPSTFLKYRISTGVTTGKYDFYLSIAMHGNSAEH